MQDLLPFHFLVYPIRSKGQIWASRKQGIDSTSRCLKKHISLSGPKDAQASDGLDPLTQRITNHHYPYWFSAIEPFLSLSLKLT